MASPKNKTSVSRIKSVERHRRDLELRRGGATFRQIVDSIGYASTNAAFRAVERALIELVRKPAEAIRKVGDQYSRSRLTPRVKSLMESWFRWTR